MLATRIVAIFSAVTGCMGAIAPDAGAQIRIGQWNITNWRSTSVNGDTMNNVIARGTAFQTAIYAIAPNSLQFAPDVLIVQEIFKSATTGNAIAANAFRDVLNSAPGSPGDWATATFVINQGDTSNAMFYRTSKVALLDVATLGTASGATPDVGSGDGIPAGEAIQSPRDNQRWHIRLVGYTGPGAELYMYGTHMKAQGGNNSNGRREMESKRIRLDSNALPANAGGFLVSGDFNITDSDDLAYQYYVNYGAAAAAPMNTQAGQFFDPIIKSSDGSGSWNSTCSFRNIHTQEPTANAPTSGGMDDRFDQILVSASLRDMQGLSYIPADKTGNPLARILIPFINPTGSCAAGGNATDWNDPNHSFRCWGNDGNHINVGIIDNASIPSDVNTEVGTDIARALVTTCDGNGHLPVFLDMQVPAKVGVAAAINFGTVTLNAAANMTLSVTNAANVALYSKDGTGWGVDGLTYTLTASSGFTAPVGTFERAANGGAPLANMHTITMNTSTPGVKTGTITIASDDPDNPMKVVNLMGTVIAATVTCCKGTTCTTTLTMSQCTTPDGTGLTGHVITTCDPNHTSNQGCCYADFDHSGSSTIDDIFFYLNVWFTGSGYARFDGNGTMTPSIDDIFLFLNAWFTGCTNP